MGEKGGDSNRLIIVFVQKIVMTPLYVKQIKSYFLAIFMHIQNTSNP